MYEELIERLRNKADTLSYFNNAEDYRAAADAIEELARRNNNQIEFVQQVWGNKELIFEEIARRDTTDGTIKVFSGKEIAEIVEKVWRRRCTKN